MLEARHAHDMSSDASSSGDMMSMSTMQMTFFVSDTTPLYAMAWAPSNAGSYSGTCIFLIVLAIIFRCLMAGKAVVEQRWRNDHFKRRYIKVRGQPTESEQIDNDPATKEGLLTTGGVEQEVRVVQNRGSAAMPFRLSRDLPRAAYVTVTAGVGYLL